jgi:hypothetical protein
MGTGRSAGAGCREVESDWQTGLQVDSPDVELRGDLAATAAARWMLTRANGRWLESQNLVGWWCSAFVRLGFEGQRSLRLQLQVGILGHSPAHTTGSCELETNLNGLMGIAGGGTLSLMELVLLN